LRGRLAPLYPSVVHAIVAHDSGARRRRAVVERGYVWP